MGSLADMMGLKREESKEKAGKTQAKAVMAQRESQRAWDEGRKMLVFQTRNTFSGGIEGSVKGVAEAIEAAEEVGWHYESSTYAFDQRGQNSLVGIHFFRRP